MKTARHTFPTEHARSILHAIHIEVRALYFQLVTIDDARVSYDTFDMLKYVVISDMYRALRFRLEIAGSLCYYRKF